MSWIGTWRNQYGSSLRITDDADGRINGFFRTALSDSSFFGQELSVSGVHKGDCISFAFVGGTRGDAVCSFTGLLREDRIQTVWHVVADVRTSTKGEKTSWPHAVMTNADVFERID
jgi:hypothetical protein